MSDTPAEQPEAGTRLSARQIHENILRPGEHEMERPAASLLWSAVASGLVIGFSFVAAAFATQLAPGEYGQGGTRVRNELRVCADPNNLPFSNAREEGLENRVAELLAAELGAEVQYTWWAQRRGFFRNTLDTGLCDVVMGVPGGFERALLTRPYYRSTYVFVSRAGHGFDVGSFDDPLLGRARVGVHLVGDDYANPPPVHALARRGLVRNVVGFMLYGDYREPNPPARLVEAVAHGDVDVAVVWGPFAGYFGPRTGVPLRIAPVTPAYDGPSLPMVFEIAVGVRRGDVALRAKLDAALERRQAEVRRILEAYGVPAAAPEPAASPEPAPLPAPVPTAVSGSGL